MHCFASENQTYTGTWLFGVESWKSLKGQENLLLKNLQVKTRVENVRFLSWRIFFVGKYGIQSTNEMAFKRTVTLRASFRFPAIRFDAPTLLSFSGFTHAHAKCPPVRKCNLTWETGSERLKQSLHEVSKTSGRYATLSSCQPKIYKQTIKQDLNSKRILIPLSLFVISW